MKQLTSYFLLTFMLLCTKNVLTHDLAVDVVIPCHEKDLQTLDLAIAAIKKYGKNVRRVIVVSAQKLTDNAEWFDESNYPFTSYDIALAIFNDHAAAKSWAHWKWVYQQLLKLYAPIVIPDIAPNVFILDADTIFLNDVSFFDEQNYALYNVAHEYHMQYFMHAKRLLPNFKRAFEDYSGVCHCMLFQRHVIDDLFHEIRSHHHTEPWLAIASCISKFHIRYCCMSEYELYFNFVFSGTYNVKINPLKWKDMPFDVENLVHAQNKGFHYVSCHSWMQATTSSTNKSFVTYISIPKSGSHLFRNVLEYLYPNNRAMHKTKINIPSPTPQPDLFFNPSTEEIFYNTHYNTHQNWLTHLIYTPERAELLNNPGIIKFFMYRDPRDQIISLAYFIKKDPNRWPDAVNVSLEDLITDIIDGGHYTNGFPPTKNIAELYAAYLPWINCPDVCAVRFENLVGPHGGGSADAQLKEILKIAHHLEVTPSESLLTTITQNIFGNKRAGSTFRKGQIGEWKTHFTEQHKKRVKELIGQLLIDLDYEKDDTW